MSLKNNNRTNDTSTLVGILQPIAGFVDRIGADLKKQRLVEQIFRIQGYQTGCDEIETPILEKSEALPREVFSGWTDKDFIGTHVKDYSGSSVIGTKETIFRPEGTLPVCRYVALELAKGNDILPLKVMYTFSCYRNEDVKELSLLKRRSFSQLGVEYLGYDTRKDDVEMMRFAYSVLRSVGIPQEDIRFRINSVVLFDQICNDLGYTNNKVELQNSLDTFSKKRAEGTSDCLELSCSETDKKGMVWNDLLNQYLTYSSLGPCKDELGEICDGLNEHGIPAVVDLTVVRGFSYYTGCTFQIDVRQDGKWVAEIAGGGRYDSVIGNYLNSVGINKEVPATGMAFGTERLTALARLPEGKKYTLDFNL